MFFGLFKRAKPASRKQTPSPRLRVESLEDRTVPSTVTVTPASMAGWITQASGTAQVSFETGPGTPPAGTGSVQLSVGADGNSAAQVRTNTYAGTALADLTALSYSTYVQQDGSGGQAPYLILNIDLDGNVATIEDQLFFEPVYQTGAYSGDPVPNQGAVTTGTWQTWDALAGGWWSLDAGTFGPPLVTLSTYIAANPTATIASSSSGGVRIVAGFGAGAWDNFVGNADNFTIAVDGDSTSYDFETAKVYSFGTTTLAVDEATGDFTFTYKDTNNVVHTITGTGARFQNGKLKIHAQGTDELGNRVKIDVDGPESGPLTVSLRGKDKKEFGQLTLEL